MRSGGASFLAVLFLSVSFVGPAEAGTFFDDFSGSAASPWGNEQGAWMVGDRGYGATVVKDRDFPSASSSLPWDLDDFTLDLDINNVQDGGVWLRSTLEGGTLGRTGVVLVTGGYGGTGTGLYWHIAPGVTRQADYDGILFPSDPKRFTFTPGESDPHIQIVVSGNIYSAFVDGVFATSLETPLFASGQVALFDSGPGYPLDNPGQKPGQTFDNVRLVAQQIVVQQVVPEPATYALLLAPAIILLGSRILARR